MSDDKHSVKINDLPPRELTHEEMKEVQGAFAKRSIARFGGGGDGPDTSKTQTLDDDGEVRYDDTDDGRDNGKSLMGF